MKGFIFAFFLLITGSVYAQYTLEAVVLDGMTRRPVPNVNVYLNGTSRGTSTDLQGRFRIVVPEIINTSLVVSHIGYEKIIILDPFRSLPKTLFLEEHIESIDEVTVKSKIDQKKRREMLELFKKYFFGDRAYMCKILNEKDLYLYHDKEKMEITGTAHKPLEIVNNYLKYYIRLDLHQFQVLLSRNEPEQIHTIDLPKNTSSFGRRESDNPLLRIPALQFSYIATVHFTDVGGSLKTLQARRENDYYQSFRYLLYLLGERKIKEEEMSSHFHLVDPDYKGKYLSFLDQDSVFTISQSLDYPSMKMMVIRPEIQDSTTGFYPIMVANHFNKQPLSHSISAVEFYADTFIIDTYGNEVKFGLNHNVFLDGDFGKQRFGTMLPLDYMPEQILNSGATIPKDTIPNTAAERIRYYIERQVMLFPQEKIHLHTDKTNYIAGETLWFRVYLSDYTTNAPSGESHYVYGELYDPADSLVLRIKIRADDFGTFKGYLDLPPDLVEGHYRLRFYTRYMEESGEEFFYHQRIYIGNPFAAVQPAEEEVTLSDYDVSFFPEGGALPANVPVRIAFKALGEDGFGLTVKGKIVNRNGDEVTTFTSNELGMGSFTITANPEERYTAQCVDSQGLEKQFELPEIKNNVINLKAVQNKDEVSVEILHSVNAPKPDSLYLLIQCRGAICFIERMTIDEKRSYPKEALPSGVIQLLLLNDKLKPLSERLIFNLNDNDLAQIKITPSKEIYQKRELVELSIDLTTNDSVPIQDSFSLSVTQNTQHPENLLTNNYTLNSNNYTLNSNNYTLNSNNHTLNSNNHTLLTTLLLTSDLKGYIEKPAWYFSDDRAIEELDHLLLTQGWSRYNMTDLMEGFYKKPKTLAEVEAEISGQIAFSMFQNSKSGRYVKLTAAGINNLQLPETVTQVEEKNFNLPYYEYPNGTSYALHIAPTNYRSMTLNETPFPKNSKIPPFAYALDQLAVEAFRNHITKAFEPYQDDWRRFQEEVLKTGDEKRGLSPFLPRRTQDKVFSRVELGKNKKITLGQFLASLDNITVRSDDNGILHIRYRNEGGYYDYVLIVDDRLFNAHAHALYDDNFKDNEAFSLENMLFMTADKLTEVAIIPAPAPPITMGAFGNLVVNDPALFGINESLSPVSALSPKHDPTLSHPGYLGTILITTTARNAGINDAVKIAPLGYQVSRDFYSPAYQTKEQIEDSAPDHRTTLFWNPDVQTDDDGHAKVRFYTSDVNADHTITIEGVTKEGILIRKTANFKVSFTDTQTSE